MLRSRWGRPCKTYCPNKRGPIRSYLVVRVGWQLSLWTNWAHTMLVHLSPTLETWKQWQRLWQQRITMWHSMMKYQNILCSTGPNSWFQQNAAIAKGESAPGIITAFLNTSARYCCEFISTYVIKTFLSIVQEERYRKKRETEWWKLAFHHMVSGAKRQLFSVETAVVGAALKLNVGYERTSMAILSKLGINLGLRSVQRLAERQVLISCICSQACICRKCVAHHEEPQIWQ